MGLNNEPRRIIFLSSLVSALVLEPFCLSWFALLGYGGTPFGNFIEGPTPLFFLTTTIALLAGIAALVFGRSRWRWLLLLLVLPLALALGSAFLDWYSVYHSQHRR